MRYAPPLLHRSRARRPAAARLTWLVVLAACAAALLVRPAASQVELAWPDALVVPSIDRPIQVRIAADGSGGAIVAWDVLLASRHRIYCLRVNADGEILWGEQAHPHFVQTTSYDAIEMELVTSDGHAYIAWIDHGVTRAAGLHVQKLHISDGTPGWSQLPSGLEIGLNLPSIAFDLGLHGDDSGNVLVTVLSHPDSPPRVYAGLLRGDGSAPELPWGASGLVQIPHPYDPSTYQMTPAIVSDGQGGAVVAWIELHEGPSVVLMAQRVSPFGTMLWSTYGVNVGETPAGTAPLNPRLAFTGDGGALLAWDLSDVGGCTQVFTRRLAATNPLSSWPPAAVTACIDSGLVFPAPILFSEYPDPPGVTCLASTAPTVDAGHLTGSRLDADSGASVWYQASVTPFQSISSTLLAVGDGMGGSIVVRSGPGPTRTIEAHHVRGADGEPAGSATPVYQSTELPLVLCAGERGAAYVAGALEWDVYIQRLQVPFPPCGLPTRIDIGAVTTCTQRDTTVTITNSSAYTMPLAIAFEPGSSSAFTIPSELVPESLPPGESVDLPLRYAPTAVETDYATLHITYDCRVELAGQGVAPSCAVFPQSLDFGDFVRGESLNRSLPFEVRNNSSGWMSGTVSLSTGTDSRFSLAGGTTTYSLGPGDAHTFLVEFSYDGNPDALCDTYGGTILTGDACDCADVQLSANLTDYGQLGALPEGIDFGERETLADPDVDPPYELSLVLANETDTGCGTWGGYLELAGVPDPPDPDDPPIFSTNPGDTVGIELPPQQAQNVTVYFRPYEPRSYGATLRVHDAMTEQVHEITLQGSGGFGEPVCAFCEGEPAPPDTLEFAPVLGESSSVVLCLTNLGGGALTGQVTLEGEGSRAFSLWGTTYDLAHAETDSVRVTFFPAALGRLECELDLGTSCTELGPLVLIGDALAPGECRLSPAELDFGTVVAGTSETRTITLHNDGEVPITAWFSGSTVEALGLTPPEPSDCIEVGDGLRFVQVGGGDSCAIPFVFTPPEMAGGVTVEGSITLEGACAGLEIPCSGNSVNWGVCQTNVNYPGEPPPGEEQDLDFGAVAIGSADTLSFAIQNIGLEPCTAISGEVYGCWEGMGAPQDGPPFTITEGAGTYSLGCGAARIIRVRFAPTDLPAAWCEIFADCSVPVLCTGSGLPEPPRCSVEPPEGVTFGPSCFCPLDNTPRGAVATQVRIRNVGHSLLAGTVTLDGDTTGLSLEGPADSPSIWPQYELPDSGDVLRFTVVFRARDALPHAATVRTGSAACTDLPVSAHGYHPGDIDRNDVRSLADLQRLLDHLLQRELLPPDESLSGFGDLNCDARIDVADLVSLGYDIGETVARGGEPAIFAGLTAPSSLPRLPAHLRPLSASPDGAARWELLLEAGPQSVELVSLLIPRSACDDCAEAFDPAEGWMAWSASGEQGLALVTCRDPRDGTYRNPANDSGMLSIGTLRTPADWMPAVASGECVLGLLLGTDGLPKVLSVEPADHAGPGTGAARLALIVPNPSAGAVSLLLESEPATTLRLEIFDLQGRRAATLWDGPAGREARWILWEGLSADARPAPSGVYFARLSTDRGMQQYRIMLLR